MNLSIPVEMSVAASRECRRQFRQLAWSQGGHDCRMDGDGGEKAGSIGASGLGPVLPGIDTQFLHACDEGCSVDAHASRGSIGSSNTALALGEGAHDLFALLLGIFIGGPLPIQSSVNGFLHDTCDVFLRGLGGSRSRISAWLA